ncbi:MAG: protein kinase [Candidatus Riflebacteria bacterium]|nr:protein kinase [Candidatus Riflebacteria bacterium]
MARRKHNPKQSQTDIKDSWGEQKTTDSFAGKTVRRQSGAVSQTASEGLSSANAEKLLTSVQNDEKAARSSFARWFEDLPEYRVAFAKEEETLSSLNFSLQKKLGEGGMGVVYSGVQKSIGREIAIKFLKQEYLDDKDAARRFIQEGQITGRLDHPNILPIFDLGRSQKGDLFIAMQKISGKRWDQVFSQKRPKKISKFFCGPVMPLLTHTAVVSFIEISSLRTSCSESLAR